MRALDLADDPVLLFGEGAGRAVVALPPGDVDALDAGLAPRRIGEVGGDSLLGVTVLELSEAWVT